MKIDRLQLHNFRNFEDETFEFPTLFTVIIGVNGKGKSSILEGLRVASAAFLLGIDEAERFHIQKENIRRIDVGNRFATQKRCSVQAKGIVNNNEIVWKRTIEREGGRTDLKDAKQIIQIAQELNNRVNIDLDPNVNLPVICYFNTARLWAEPKQAVKLKKKGSKLKDGYARSVDERNDKISPMEWIKSFYWKKLKDKPESVLLEAVLEAITTCVPNWEPYEWDEDTDDLAGKYTYEDNTTCYMPLFYLSDGLRTMASMVAQIAYRCVTLNEHLGRNAVKDSRGIVLIDELDMHLHPNWQRSVVSDLKKAFPNIQFIATTHSPFIVQSLKSNELIILDNDCFKDGDPFRKSIEDVSIQEMGVPLEKRSLRFEEMTRVAEEYYKLVAEEKSSANDPAVNELRQKLNDLEELFGEDPAFIAALRVERKSKGL